MIKDVSNPSLLNRNDCRWKHVDNNYSNKSLMFFKNGSLFLNVCFGIKKTWIFRILHWHYSKEHMMCGIPAINLKRQKMSIDFYTSEWNKEYDKKNCKTLKGRINVLEKVKRLKGWQRIHQGEESAHTCDGERWFCRPLCTNAVLKLDPFRTNLIWR